jgi:hypothetical protein
MLGWPNHPIGGGRPPRLAWGGLATPKPAGLGAVEPPPMALGVVRPPLGPNAQKQNFERLAQGAPNYQTWATGGGSAAPWAKRSNFRLAQGAAEPPCGPLGVVRPPPDGRPRCG